MLRLPVVILSVALTLACSVGTDSNADENVPRVPTTDVQDERQVFITYSVSNLPVWGLDEQGETRFDATVLIAYLRNCVDTKTLIVPSAENRALIVRATQKEHEKVRHALTPLWAFGGSNIVDQLQEKLSDAKIANQNVLVFASDPNVDAVRQFFDLKADADDLQLQNAFRNYALQCIRKDQADILKDLGLAVPRGEEATLAILDSQGKLVTQVAFHELASDGRTLSTGLRELLDLHKSAFPKAGDELATAYAEATRDEKRVLLQLSGPNCAPCIRLSRFLDSQRELIVKDYVYTKLDTRMPGASDVIRQLRTDARGPVPWMAVLSADGRVLATSDGPDGNIGYPQSQRSRAHFEQMLLSTSKRLSSVEILRIIDGLGETAERGSGPR